MGFSPLAIAVVFGLTVAVMIYALGHLSGAHFNPAVTLAFAVTKHFPFGQIGAYWLSQITGAFLAIGLLALLTPNLRGFGAAATHVRPWQTFGWEGVMTFLLMLVIIIVATNAGVPKLLIGASIGAMVTLDSLVGGPVTGAAMNPARYLAPALTEGKLDFWWIYLAGAFIGAALAGLFYEKIR